MKLSQSRKVALGKAADRFHESLDEAHWAYLSSRGITVDMAAQYKLGVVSADAGPTFEPYVGRLSLPFLTPTGVVSIRYRCIVDHDCKDEGHPKYLQGKGEGDHLYNVGAFHERHPAIGVAEGEIDAAFSDTFVLPTVGVPGATKWKPYWTRLFEDFERIFVLGDGDKAGREFCDKLTELLPNAQPVIFPADHDVNSFFLAHGEEALADYVLGESQG